MKINTVVVGSLEENCYLLEKENMILVIDPGAEADKIISHIGTKQVVGILITHHHFDHVGALDKLKEKYGVPVYDFSSLEEKNYEVGLFHFEVLFTAGHSSDSVTYYFKEDQVMFVGDFLFQNSIGRTDLPTGNMLEMKQSIKKIKQYDDNIILYPGHGVQTILGIEKQYNPFLRRF